MLATWRFDLKPASRRPIEREYLATLNAAIPLDTRRQDASERPTLPADAKAAILAIVEAAGTQ